MALGLGYWQMMRLIILPQALKIVIPGIVNTFIGLFKDTTLVLDHRHLRPAAASSQAALHRSELGDAGRRRRPATSSPAIFYLVFCFGMSRYAHVHRAPARRPATSGRNSDDADDVDAQIAAVKPAPLGDRGRGRDRRHEQVVRRVPRAARHQSDGHARRAHRHLRAVGLRQVDA